MNWCAGARPGPPGNGALESRGLRGRRQGLSPEFLRDQEVEVIASLPCYLEQNVDAQRGPGAYARSIQGLQESEPAGIRKTWHGIEVEPGL